MVEFKVPPIKPRMAVEVRFIVPDNCSHVTFRLLKDEQNYPIQGTFRWNENNLCLNSMYCGGWQNEIHVPSCFNTGDDIAIRFEARDEHFLIYVNGKEVNQFKYRLPLSDIKMAKTIPGEGLKVISYSVHY